MGTIKDITDLITQLAKSIKDRELTSKLFEIQSLVAQFQSENIELQKEILDLKKAHQELQQKFNDKNLKTIFHANLLWLPDDHDPYCPVCYESEKKLIHMHKYEKQEMSNNDVYTKPALRCPNFQKCNHVTDIAQHP